MNGYVAGSLKNPFCYIICSILKKTETEKVHISCEKIDKQQQTKKISKDFFTCAPARDVRSITSLHNQVTHHWHRLKALTRGRSRYVIYYTFAVLINIHHLMQCLGTFIIDSIMPCPTRNCRPPKVVNPASMEFG